ncbi:MAG: glycosyltransferase family 4 protein [Actinomycetota bacterium]
MRARVGINLLYLKPGLVGGSEEYVIRLIHALDAHGADEVELTLFVNRRFPGAHPDIAAAHETVVAPISGDSPPVRIAVESTWLARETARRPLDVVHHMANTIPQVRTRPAVVTLHDVQPVVRPQDFGRVKGTYLRARLGPTARRARVITTPTEYVRRLAIERFGRAEDRVVVVPAPAPTITAAASSATLAIEGPYFVYPAITHRHKNHVTLLRAFARVAAARPDVSLILTGGPGERERRVVDEVARLRLGDRVRRVGRIDRGALDALLRGAVALTFPSEHEGYGLPVTEAMALGCAVIASDATALPEVVGGAGLLVGPHDVDGWAGAMVRLLDEESTRAALVAAGHERVRSLTSADSARRLVAAYRLAIR